MITTFTGDIDIADIKRCYVDMRVTAPCSHCSSECTTDLSQNYISYPVINKKFDISVYCSKCDDWFDVSGIITSAIISIDIEATNAMF